MNTDNQLEIALDFAKSLNGKTSQRKLEWKAVRTAHPDLQQLQTVVMPNYVFSITKDADVYGFSMRELPGITVFEHTVDINPKYGYSKSLEKGLADELEILFQQARVQAYDLDSKLRHAKDILEKL